MWTVVATILNYLLKHLAFFCLGELGDMRKQMKTLEEKNEVYMQQTISLEEDSKRVSSLKAQVELYKTQIHDLHNKLMEAEKKSDKAEFDAQRATEKFQSMEAENQVQYPEAY